MMMCCFFKCYLVKAVVLILFFALIPCVSFSAIGPPSLVLNDSDNALLRYDDVPGPDQQQLVILESGGTAHVIAATVDSAPSTGLTFDGFPPFFAMNNSNNVAFKAGLSDDGSAVYTGGIASALTFIVRNGDVLGSYNVSDLSPFVDINDSNQVGFVAEHGGANIKGLYRYTPGTGIEIIAVHGQDVGGLTITELAPYPYVNSSGQMLTKATLSDGSQAFYLLGPTAGTRTLVARSGTAGPGGTFGDMNHAAFNDAGQVAFKCEIDGVDSLVLYSGGGYTIIAQAGDDVGGGATIEGIARNWDINNNGDVVFKAGLTGISGVNLQDPAGIYHWNGSSIQEIARTGDIVGSNTFVEFSSSVTINDNNNLFFIAQFEDDDGPNGLYSWCSTSGILLIVREGGSVNGKTVAELGIFGDVFERHVNENNRIVYKLDFEDDTDGVFISQGCQPPSSTLAIPTMSEWGMIIMSLILVGSAVYFIRSRGLRQQI